MCWVWGWAQLGGESGVRNSPEPLCLHFAGASSRAVLPTSCRRLHLPGFSLSREAAAPGAQELHVDSPAGNNHTLPPTLYLPWLLELLEKRDEQLRDLGVRHCQLGAGRLGLPLLEHTQIRVFISLQGLQMFPPHSAYRKCSPPVPMLTGVREFPQDSCMCPPPPGLLSACSVSPAAWRTALAQGPSGSGVPIAGWVRIALLPGAPLGVACLLQDGALTPA